MAARKTTSPPAGPECLGCRALAADLARLQRKQRQQTADLRKLEVLYRAQAAELTETRELSRKLEEALNYTHFVQPYLLHQFSQHLPEGNALVAGLAHFN